MATQKAKSFAIEDVLSVIAEQPLSGYQSGFPKYWRVFTDMSGATDSLVGNIHDSHFYNAMFDTGWDQSCREFILEQHPILESVNISSLHIQMDDLGANPDNTAVAKIVSAMDC